MIIFRGDAEFGVEIVKFALRRTKITLSRHGMCPDAGIYVACDQVEYGQK